ncbi:MAG: ferritin [Candidatus Lokiarchaeota archaeon]|nr:ferritin [Candidatus Lokiarchaeota archaeon]
MPQEYLDLLNKAVSREISVSIQYMLQHSKLDGTLKKRLSEANILNDETTFDVLGKLFEEIAITEMEHAEEIAERVFILGGEATTKPDPKPVVGNSIKEFLQLGVKAEEEALTLYRQLINETMKVGDYTTRQLFMKIYKEEEEHLIKFKEFLG